MSTTKVESRNIFSRLKGALAGGLFGLALLVAMLVLLFWNEGRAVKTARALAQGAGSVTTVDAAQVDPAGEGRLVYLGGPAQAPQAVVDTQTGVAAQALRLQRTVEMYQWQEERDSKSEVKLGGSETTATTYSYAPAWSATAIDSSRFDQAAAHTNPAMQLEAGSQNAQGVQLGAWSLDGPVLDQLPASQPLPVSQYELAALQGVFGSNATVSLVDGVIYIGANPQQPAVGDYRISYSIAPVGPVSLVGRQTGHGLRGWQADNGRELLLVRAGSVPPETMFADARSGNATMTWVLRAVGTVAVIVAISMMLAPLSVVASVVPMLGRLLSMGTGLIAGAVGVALSVLTMALAWFVYRPLLSLAILALGAAIIACMVVLLRRRRAASALPAPVVATGNG